MLKEGEISLEQLYKMLHISKRKAAWMLNNGIIPCQIRPTKTHRYIINIFYYHITVTDCIKALVTQRSVFYGKIYNILMGIKSGDKAIIKIKISAMVGAHKSPTGAIHNTVLTNIFKMNSNRKTNRKIVRPHRNRLTCTSDSAVYLFPAKKGIPDRNVCT